MDVIEAARAKILDRLIRIIALTGAVAVIPSVYASLESGFWAVAAVDGLAYAGIVATALSKRIKYRFKLAVLIGSSFAIAAIVLYATGPYGAGYAWLICAIFCSSLLGSRRLILASAFLSTAVLGGYALLIALARAPYGQPILTILIVAANLILICLMVALSARSLIGDLERLGAEERRLSARLGEEIGTLRKTERALRAEVRAKAELVRELNHRVRNNMQVVASLLGLEAAQASKAPRPAGGGIERVIKQVRALSLANELLLASPGAEDAELNDLVVASIDAGLDASSKAGIASSTRFAFRIPSESAGPIAVVISEILDAVGKAELDVHIRLLGPAGAERLAFGLSEGQARGPEVDSLEEVARSLGATPLVAGLAGRGGLSFSRPEAALLLVLPRSSDAG